MLDGVGAGLVQRIPVATYAAISASLYDRMVTSLTESREARFPSCATHTAV